MIGSLAFTCLSARTNKHEEDIVEQVPRKKKIRKRKEKRKKKKKKKRSSQVNGFNSIGLGASP